MVLKKYLILFIILFFPAFSHAFIEQDGTLNTSPGRYYQIYDSTTDSSPLNGFNSNACIQHGGGGLDCASVQTLDGVLINLGANPNITIINTSGFLACFGLSRSQCEAVSGVVTALWPVPPPPPLGLFGIVNNAQTGFSSTTGFAMTAGVTWAGDNFIKVFMGSGLSVLYHLRYWILAMIICLSIIYFSYRAMQKFK